MNECPGEKEKKKKHCKIAKCQGVMKRKQRGKCYVNNTLWDKVRI